MVKIKRNLVAVLLLLAVLSLSFGRSFAAEIAGERGNRRPDIEASQYAVDQLKTYLQVPRPDRTPLAEQRFAPVALTRKDAEQASRLLWADHVGYIKETRANEMQACQITVGKLTMPFYYSVTGDKPKTGRSLYISLHGGGETTQEINDSQWNNQKKLYQVPEGVYLVPRAPTDTWNMWHQEHIDGMFDRLIENLIVFEDVNPNRVYLLGYSAGGDGVYQVAPRMADRFSGAAMMAGHPNEASPLGLRNIAFTIQMGENDSGCNRNTVARQWGQTLDRLQESDSNGYVHWVKIYGSKGHWLDGEDAVAIPWMAKYSRKPFPKKIVWKQDDVIHSRFYWLSLTPEDCRCGVEVRATLEGQQFDVQAGDIKQLIIRVNDHMLDLDDEVIVKSEGKELFKGHVERSIATLSKTLAERGDPVAIFSAEIIVSTESTIY